jgi:uncharacterized membrane protein
MNTESEYSEFTEYTTDSNIDLYDTMYIEEEEFVETEKQNGKYYIGVCDLIGLDYIIGMVISLRLFYNNQYTHQQKLDYMYEYDIYDSIEELKNMEIMELNISNDGSYHVIIKTFWIKIIQRFWRNTCRKRKEMIIERSKNQYYFMVHGKYPHGLNRFPSVKYWDSNTIVV